MFYVIACKRGFDVKFSAVPVKCVSSHRTSGAAIADCTRRNIAFANRNCRLVAPIDAEYIRKHTGC